MKNKPIRNNEDNKSSKIDFIMHMQQNTPHYAYKYIDWTMQVLSAQEIHTMYVQCKMKNNKP